MKYDYYKDSLISGHNCQLIRRYYYANCQSGLYAQYQTPIFTYSNSNVVYVNDYTSSVGVQLQTFDTLFCFNVPIGYKWLMTPISYTDCTSPNKSLVTVIDTGHKLVQGVNLKWQKVNYNVEFGSMSNIITDTIYERFGYLKTDPFNQYNFCTNIADLQTGVSLRCYEDNQITNFKYGHNYNCNYITSTFENTIDEAKIVIYPNPVKDYIEISSNTHISSIEVYNAFGEVIVSTPFKHHIDLSSLSSGMYFITLKDISIKKNN